MRFKVSLLFYYTSLICTIAATVTEIDLATSDSSNLGVYSIHTILHRICKFAEIMEIIHILIFMTGRCCDCSKGISVYVD